MSYKVFQLSKARNEIINAWDWYESKQRHLGDRFLNEIKFKINIIAENPHHYPEKDKYREAQMEDFPFIIVFDVNEIKRSIRIVSIFHTSRYPGKKY